MYYFDHILINGQPLIQYDKGSYPTLMSKQNLLKI